MSRPRLKLWFLVDTQAHAATIVNAITTEINVRPKFSLDHAPSSGPSLDEVGWEVSFDVRLLDKVTRQAILTWIKNQVQDHPQVKTWIKRARLSTHLCTHDDEQVLPCNTTEFEVVWEK